MTDIATGDVFDLDTIAVLGLGAMGLPMAELLAETHAVRAFDVFPARTELAVAAGATGAATATEACTGARVVVVSVNNGAQFESAMWGEGGAVAGLTPGSVVILTSTVGTESVQRAAARLLTDDIHLIDAAVSGGAVRAREGTLLVMVGASAQALALAQPILDELAGTLYVVGPKPGDGQTMKGVNQVLCGIHIAASAEALRLASKVGLDMDTVLTMLTAGAADSWMLGDRGPRILQRLRGEEPEVRSRLDIISKDMGIVHDLARSSGVSVPLAAMAEQIFLRHMAEGRSGDDDSVVVLE